MRAASLERAQAAVELALLMPVLILLLAGTLEGGTFLSEHTSVVNAAREGARFMLDGGTNAELANVVRGTTHGLPTTDPTHYQAWVITGQTNASGVITGGNWSATQVVGPSPALTPTLTAAQIQARLGDCNTGASPCGVAANVRFVAVEVAFRHDSLIGPLTLPGGGLTLRSYSIVRRI